MLRLEIGMGFDKRAAVDEACPIAVVQIGLGCDAFRKNYVVLVGLDMPVLDA